MWFKSWCDDLFDFFAISLKIYYRDLNFHSDCQSSQAIKKWIFDQPKTWNFNKNLTPKKLVYSKFFTKFYSVVYCFIVNDQLFIDYDAWVHIKACSGFILEKKYFWTKITWCFTILDNTEWIFYSLPFFIWI